MKSYMHVPTGLLGLLILSHVNAASMSDLAGKNFRLYRFDFRNTPAGRQACEADEIKNNIDRGQSGPLTAGQSPDKPSATKILDGSKCTKLTAHFNTVAIKEIEMSSSSITFELLGLQAKHKSGNEYAKLDSIGRLMDLMKPELEVINVAPVKTTCRVEVSGGVKGVSPSTYVKCQSEQSDTVEYLQVEKSEWLGVKLFN